MIFEKKIIATLNKCYSIAPLFYNNTNHFLVAAEKKDPCLLFDMDGNLEETVWDAPGGVMSMVQLPGSNGQFLATWKFYSPNDSADACIVLATPSGKNNWNVQTICKLPFVHRFDILTKGNTNYLIACTLKSNHAHKDDWSSPGKVYSAVLPEDLSIFSEESPLPLTVIKDNMTKNHGYCHIQDENGMSALIASSEGVFRFIPPDKPKEEWMISRLIDEPTSDAALIDLDGDGKEELITIAPFHGSQISIFKQKDGKWLRVFSYGKEAEFSHAIWCGKIKDSAVAVIGHREGDKSLLLFTYDSVSASYRTQIIDQNCGPANVTFLEDGSRHFLVATNREINEIAAYHLIS